MNRDGGLWPVVCCCWLAGWLAAVSGGGGWDPKYEKQTLNVRTVLFRDVDACKRCWSRDELDLLVARRHMQELVPRKMPKDFPLLLHYVQLSMETLKSQTSPDDYMVMKLAMYDVFGGYLKAVVIPMLDEAYYAGNVGYGVAAELHAIYGQIMAFLGTDGGSWSSPCDMRKIPTKVVPLPITMCKHKESCDALLLPKPPALPSSQAPNPESSDNGTLVPTAAPASQSICAETAQSSSPIPLPYLDDKSYPNAIAIPFKERSLFSLMTTCSAYILPKYYILAMRCITGPSYHQRDIVNFNRDFHRWIVSNVQPHLHDLNRWYPGFGGVMRIVETMNEKGLASKEMIPPDLSPGNDSVPCDIALDLPCDYHWWLKFIVIIVIVFLLVALLACLICCILFCCRRKRKRKDIEEGISDEVPPGMLNTLVSIYCGLKDNSRDEYGLRQGTSEEELQSTESDKPRNKRGGGESKRKAKYYGSDMDTADELSEGPSGILKSSSSTRSTQSTSEIRTKRR